MPAGTAPLFSTLLMLAIPAAVAGVPVRAAVTPPGPTGQPHPVMILAADLAGLDALWIVGGAQAIAALTFGVTIEDGGLAQGRQAVRPRQRLCGRGQEAGRRPARRPGVDMPAGPSELMVIADRQTNPTIAAADLLSQAEHDADAQVILVCDDDKRIEYILEEIDKQLADLPRAAIARASLNEGRVIRVKDTAEAAEVANLYGPEHLSIQTADAEDLVDRITAAGAVFVGDLRRRDPGRLRRRTQPRAAHRRRRPGLLGGVSTGSLHDRHVGAAGEPRTAPACSAPSPPVWPGWRVWRPTPAPPI